MARATQDAFVPSLVYLVSTVELGPDSFFHDDAGLNMGNSQLRRCCSTVFGVGSGQASFFSSLATRLRSGDRGFFWAIKCRPHAVWHCLAWAMIG